MSTSHSTGADQPPAAKPDKRDEIEENVEGQQRSGYEAKPGDTSQNGRHAGQPERSERSAGGSALSVEEISVVPCEDEPSRSAATDGRTSPGRRWAGVTAASEEDNEVASQDSYHSLGVGCSGEGGSSRRAPESEHDDTISAVQDMFNYLWVKQVPSYLSTMVFNPKSLKFSVCGVEPKLNAWFPDRIEFWRGEGSVLAWRNLIVSQFALVIAFAVWLMWSIIVVHVQSVHDRDPTRFSFGFDEHDTRRYNSQLYLLPALSGLSGGTFRITNSFMIMPVGGRVTIMMTTILLLLPCILAACELSRPEPQLWVLAAGAMLSGIIQIPSP